MEEDLALKMLRQPKPASSLFSHMKTVSYVLDFVKGVLATCVKVGGTDAVVLLSEGTGERPHVTG